MNYRQKSTAVQSAIPHQPRAPHTYPFPRNNTTQSQYQRAPVFQTGRSEEFNRTHLYGAPQQSLWNHPYQNPSVRHLQNSGIQQATGSPPHDMNKQSPLPPQQHNPTPGLYGAAPTSAVVSGPAGQQMPGASQSQVPGPTQGAPSVAAVQSQGQQQMVGRNQAAMANPYYAHRPPPQRSMQPMMQPMNPTMSPLSRPATPTNPAQIQQFYLASTGPFPSMPAAPQASIMVGPMPGFPQRNQYPSPQYGVQSSQPMFVSNAGTSYTTYQLPQAHSPYYQMLALQVQGRGGMNQMGQGAMVGEQKKSQKKIITIQDPDTGQDVTEQIMSSANTSSATTPTSVASNYKGTPPPETQQPHNEIAAQFAAQVAAVATPAVGSKPVVPMPAVIPMQEPPPPPPPAMMDYVEPPSVHAMDASNANDASVAATAALADEDVAGSSTVQMCPDLVCEAQHGGQENYEPEMAAALQDHGVAEDKDAGGSAKGDGAGSEEIPVLCAKDMRTERGEAVALEQVAVAELEMSEANGPVESADKPALEMVQPVDVCGTGEAFVGESKKASADAVVAEASVASDALTETGINYAKPPSRKASVEKAAEMTEMVKDDLKGDEVKREHQQQNGDVGDAKFPLPTPGREVEAKEKRMARGKKREKELNRKGDSKEGGEMDAFVVDSKPETVVPTTVVTPSVPPPSKSPSPVTVVTTPDDSEKDAIEEEERRVARKNEENALKNALNAVEESTPPPLIEPPKPQIKLPFDYKEDQWSPINQEGKKQYDREFLLKLARIPMSIRKPEGLPNLDIMKTCCQKIPLHSASDHRPSPGLPQPRSHTADFTPSYVRPAQPRPPPGGSVSRRQSQQGRGAEKPRKIVSSSLSHDVKLHQSENAWKPTYKPTASEIAADEEAKTQDLYKKVRGVLNKLTPQKFQTLVDQVKDLPINTEDRLKGVIDLVFEKAVDEPNYSVPYANMCKQLAMLKVPVAGGREDEYVNFRKLLLNKCQREFEKDTSEEIKREERLKLIENAETEEKRKQLMEELEDEGRKARRRSTGNIRFIGELFKLNMLLPAIMHDCINKLLKQGDEESLECLCRLLTTVGKDLDTEDNKKGTMAISSVQMMDSCFKTMEKIVKLKQTSSRVRFMLQDVIELRQNKWIPRRVENNPKTIDQIHKEAEKEAQEQHMILQQHIPLSSKRADDRRKGRGNVSSSLHGSDDGWQSTKSSLKMKPPIQMPSLSQVEPDTLQLGPSWTKGSGSNWGGGSKSSASDSKQNQSNRFQLLGETSQFETRRGNQRSAASSRDSSRGRSSNQYSSLRKTPSQGVPGADREEVLNTVKSMVGFSASEQRPPPSKEAIGGRLSLTKEAEAVLMGSSNISQEEFERRCRHIVNEFLNNEDPAEAIQCVRELACPKNVPKLVSEAINLGLERSSHARTLIAQLMVELVQKKVITVDHYTEGLQFLLEMAEDLALDIPNLWEFLGSMIAPMISKNLVSLQKLKAASQPCIESGTAGLLFRAVLKAAVKDVGPQKVTELWKASEIQWSEILSPKEDVDAFLANGLEFLAASGAGASKPMESMRDKLLDLLTKDASNEELFDWIEANVSDKKDCQFIRALVTAVVESSIKRVEVPDHPVLEFDKFQLNKRSAVLQKYLDHTDHLEVQALYAIQALMNRLEHPQGVLWNIFSALYDDDIISEDGFMQWEHNEDPNEQEGRGVCLKSVASFFNWLKESEPGED